VIYHIGSGQEEAAFRKSYRLGDCGATPFDDADRWLVAGGCGTRSHDR